MLSFTRKSDYALVALAGLAARTPAVASAHDLAATLHLPLAALRNILKLLAAHGVVVATKGVTGGYRLARPPEQITLAQIVQAVQGPVRITQCCTEGHPGVAANQCRLEESCRIKAGVRAVHQRMMQVLNEVTLEDIATSAGEARLVSLNNSRAPMQSAHGVRSTAVGAV